MASPSRRFTQALRILGLFAAALGATGVLATSGALDTRFGTAGRTLTPVTAGGGAFRAMAVQPDGKIVAVGERYKSGSEADLLLARFEANGALDASFGTGGVAVFDSQANAPTVVLETATAVALQADGKIVVAGVSRDLGDFVIVARLTATGTLDGSFGTNGIVRAPAFPESDVPTVLVQPDGRILVGATLRDATQSQVTFGLLRFTGAGAPDTDFGCGTPGTCTGQSSDPFGPLDHRLRAIVLQPSDNRIVAVGQVTVDTGTGSRIDYAVARYNTDGTLDTSFDTDGFATGAFVASDDAMNTLASLAVLPGGEIVAGGEVADAVNGTSRMAAVRFTSAGALDGTFGTAGQAVVTTTGLSTTTAMRRQSDGKLLFAGTGDDGVTFGAPTLVRLLENGTPDPAFGTGGAIFTADLQEWTALVLRADDRAVIGGRVFETVGSTAHLRGFTTAGGADGAFGTAGIAKLTAGASGDFATAFSVLGDGRIVVAGSVRTYSALQGVLARYTATGALDGTFGTAGLTTQANAARALAIAPDGRIVVGSSSSTRFIVFRYTADGAPDTSYATTGRTSTAVSGTVGHELNALLVQPDGKIVAGGTARSSNVARFVLVRYNVDGTLDPGFGSAGKVITPVGTGAARIKALALLAGGQIVAAGQSEDGANGTRMTIVRYSSAGVVEATYQDALLSTAGSLVEAMKVDGSGRYLLTGSDGSDGVLLRVNANLTPDATFDTDGVWIGGASGYRDIAVQADGKLLLLSLGTVYRLQSTGATDTGFGTNGGADLGGLLGAASEDLRRLVVDAQGQILVAGGSDAGLGNDIDLVVARLDATNDVHPFAFAPQAGVARGTVIVSNAQAITGVPGPTSTTVTNGEFCVSSTAGCACDVRAFSAAAGTVSTGQSVCVRHTSSASYSTTVTSTLTVGTVGATFSSTTVGSAIIGISAPTPFGSQAVGTTSAGQAITISNTGTIPATNVQVLTTGDFGVSGTTCGTSLAAAASCTATVTFTPGQVGGRIGELVILSNDSQAGDVRATLTGTGIAVDTTPEAFTFTALVDVARGVTQTSNPVTIGGINAPAAISVAGGEYSIGCTATFTSAAATIANGQAVCVRHTSSALGATTVTTTLTVGGVSSGFSSTTANVPTFTPNPIALDFGGQSMNTTAPSQAVTFTNSSGSPVTVSSVTASTYFAVTHDCATLGAGASCTANVSFTPAVEGSLNGTLTVLSSSGNATVALAGTGERSLVTHYYRSILRRAPDAGGKAFWESEKVRLPSLGANVNETWYAMATFFYFSSEYQSFNRDDTGFVTDLYNTFFNRPADGGGLTFWTGLLSQGMPREVVLVSFMFSTEFQTFTQAIFGNVQARKEVDTVVDFYRGLLSRLPDDGGLASWVGQFRAAQCQGAGSVYTTVEAISSSFANGGEYASRNRTNAQYVGDLYNAFLRRGGDLGGVQFWISQLAGGATRSAIRQQFIASPEFTNRVNAIIAEGCVP